MNTTTKHPITKLGVAVSLLAVATSAFAVDRGTVAQGQASIATNGTTTTINQSGNRAVINWNNFDIGASEHVQINQPNAQSAILNRVNSSNLTQIDGSLNSNGRVFVINPNGIVVGQTGKINASAVVLSSLDINDRDFMSSYAFQAQQVAGSPSAAVVNNGTIHGDGGVRLLGGQAVNGATGTLSTNAGKRALLGAGTNAYMTLGVANSDLGIFTVSGGGTAVNDGTIVNTGSSVN
jgi:filamentous hemagglutinin family protein